jgi:predicted nuclease with TOPRIM domain
VSVGCCGPFDEDEEDPDSDYDRLAIEAEALRVKNKLLMRELKEMREVLQDITKTPQKLTEEMSRRLKGRKQRLFSRQFGLLTHSQRRSCEWRAFEMICARTIKSGGGK